MALDLGLNDLHDVYLDGEDLAITQPDIQTLQEIGIRLQFWEGEWFLNILDGIPYLQEVFKKQVNIDLISALFKNEILASDGVIELLEFELTFTSETRALRIDFKVSAELGIISKTLEVSI